MLLLPGVTHEPAGVTWYTQCTGVNTAQVDRGMISPHLPHVQSQPLNRTCDIYLHLLSCNHNQ